MKCIEAIKYLEEWAPKEIAWESDNVGLQVGSFEREIKNVLLCLDITPAVADEAVRKHCNFIISHHPLIFPSLKKISPEKDHRAQVIEKLIKNDITLYSAHTNLDFTRDGVSFSLAKKLRLQKTEFLKNISSDQVKFIIFVPEGSVETVSRAIFNAGGGLIGEYSDCSFRTPGRGTFKGSGKSNPTVGTKLKFETVDEVRLEVLVDKWKIKNVLTEALKVHPYEEPAYDIYPLQNENTRYGMGAAGWLPAEMQVNNFLEYVGEKLNIKNFRFTNGSKRTIKKVAVCGGAGIELLADAKKCSADAFITADIKYHAFREAEKKILLIDAGHYETEIFSLDEIQERLSAFLNKNSRVFKYNKSTNPVKYFRS
jgi:dinuclear metal center YbgI/SA1388 family protein